jgi:hypothetical protein
MALGHSDGCQAGNSPHPWTMTATGPSAKASLPVTPTADTVRTESVLQTSDGGIEIVKPLDAAGACPAALRVLIDAVRMWAEQGQ